MADWLKGFPAVVVGGTEIVVDQDRPIAALLGPDGSSRFVTWPDLPVGTISPLPTLLPAPDGAWVHYPPPPETGSDQDLAPLLASQDSAAVHIDATGTVTRIRTGAHHAVGTSTGALWTAPDRGQRVDLGYRGGPLPPDWSEPTPLAVHRRDGSAAAVLVDRYVPTVVEEDGDVHVVVAPTPPIAHPDGFGGTSFEYRWSEVVLPSDSAPPATIRFLEHHPDGLGPAVGPGRVWRSRRWTSRDRALRRSPGRWIDLSSVRGSRWRTAALSRDRVAAAEEAASGWFRLFGQTEDGGTGPIAEGLHDAEVQLEGAWPDTRVVLTFRHPYWPGGRLRRTLRVFDDAGRLRSEPYADVFLAEDLAASGNLPPVDAARHGVRDV